MKPYAWLTATALLAGCAAAPATHYYRLPDPEPARSSAQAAQTTVVVAVKLADFLSGNGIAYQEGDVEFKLAQQNLWAERPEAGIARVLATHLQQDIPATRWLTQGYGPQTGHLQVELQRFNGRHDGRAVLAGRWTLSDARQTLLAESPFLIEVPQQGDGYAALVRALGLGLDTLASQVAVLADKHKD